MCLYIQTLKANYLNIFFAWGAAAYITEHWHRPQSYDFDVLLKFVNTFFNFYFLFFTNKQKCIRQNL